DSSRAPWSRPNGRQAECNSQISLPLSCLPNVKVKHIPGVYKHGEASVVTAISPGGRFTGDNGCQCAEVHGIGVGKTRPDSIVVGKPRRSTIRVCRSFPNGPVSDDWSHIGGSAGASPSRNRAN